MAATSLVVAPVSAGAWTTDAWLGQPRVDATAPAPPIALTADGGAVAVTAPVGFGPFAGWDTRRMQPGGAWQAPAPSGAPAGLWPSFFTPAGALVAIGVVDRGAGPVVEAALGTAAGWTALPVVMGPAPGATLRYTAAAGPDGTLVLAATDGVTMRIVTVDGPRQAVLSAPGGTLPDLAVGESGDALAAWRVPAGPGRETVLTSRMPAGGEWSAPARAPVPRAVPAAALAFDADLSADGTAMIAWTAGAAGRHRVWWSMAGPSGRWPASSAVLPQTIPGARVEALRLTAGGDAVVLWSTTRGLAGASRAAGRHWTADGTVPGAPGRGRADRSPVQVMTDRVNQVAVAWVLRGDVALTVRPASGAPAPSGRFGGRGAMPAADVAAAPAWPVAAQVPTAPGPVSAAFAIGPGGGRAVTWMVDGGVATGRRGVAAEPARPALIDGVFAAGGGDAVWLSVAARRGGPATVTFTPVGARTPDAALTAQLQAGTTRIAVPWVAAWRLRPATAYVVAVRGWDEAPSAPGATTTWTTP